MSEVKNNSEILVHYTGKLDNGEVFDSSAGREPLAFTVGSGMVIPGFDAGVLGMKINESKTIAIPSAEAYGEVMQELIQEVPMSQLPPEIKPEVGMQLMSQAPNGQEIPLRITTVKDESIIVDANHPLAGKNLNFDLTLVQINEAE